MTKIVGDNKKRSLGEKLYTDTFKDNISTVKTADFTTDSNTFVNIPGLSETFILEKESIVNIIFTGNIGVAITASTEVAVATISIDSTDQGLEFRSQEQIDKSETGTLFFVDTLAAGSHTVTGRLRTSDSTGSVEAIIRDGRITLIY